MTGVQTCALPIFYKSEEQAKAAWLAKLDNEPSWTTVAPPAPAVYEASPAPVYANPEDAAKAAWLASLDNEPVWTVGAPAPAPLPPLAEMSGSVGPPASARRMRPRPSGWR